MMGGGGLLKGPQPAYLKFTGEMLEAFMILTDSMYKKGEAELLTHGKFTQNYTEGADELKQTPDFEATEFNTTLANKLKVDLDATAKPHTPGNIAPFMKEMVEICGNYLAQHAEFNKDKGPAFRLLIKTMKTKPNDQLYQKEKAKRTYGKAAAELEGARGLESDHDDPNLSQEIHSALSKLVDASTPAELKTDMKETLDICSKYLSQCAIDEIERGPAFDILIKELERNGAESFVPELPPLDNQFATAYTLKSAPGLSSAKPDPSTVPKFQAALHKVVDVATPHNLKKDMDDVINRCSNYLSAFIRDRGRATGLLLKMMKANASKELAKRNNYVMNYGTGATEIEASPTIVPYLPIKDIADEAKGKLTGDMESSTPPDLKLAMKSMIQDASRFLSQGIAIRSGIAGERYPMNFLAAVKRSLGTRQLFKYKVYGQTYADGAEVLKYAGPMEYDPKYQDLQYQISSEMSRGVPSKLAPTVVQNLEQTMGDASKHLAKIGTEKGEALDHLVKVMKEEGNANLGLLQGYQQTYNDGARRIENAQSLANEKVDKGAYESVRGKLTELIKKKPNSEYAKHMTGIVEETSKFLSAPFPENDAEKRRVLADLMARQGDNVVGQEGLYKMTYTEGGEEIMRAPVGVTAAHDEGKKKGMLDKVNAVIPDKRLQDALKAPANEGAAYLTDIIKGRGEAMQVIHDEMNKQKDKNFLTIGKFQKTHSQAADMIKEAGHFGGQHPAPVLLDKVNDQIKALNTSSGSKLAQSYMADTTDITSSYIAGVATEECGLDAKALAEMDGAMRKDGARMPSPLSRAESPPPKKESISKSNLEDEEARRKREEEERRRREEEERRRREEEERRKREGARSIKRDDDTQKRIDAAVAGVDPEREAALQILHNQLRARGGEMLYKQPHTELTNAQASEWLKNPPMRVDKSVKESGDTDRLHKKFERKLSALVSKSTPIDMYDTMQDVIIESSRQLSEYFVSSNYKALVREALISEMQKRGNEILIEVDGTAETFFFAAQRLKKTKSMEAKEPCNQVAYQLTKKLDDIIRCRSMARKLTATMKDHIKDAADYLSEFVTKPDEQIEAYCTLLGEMEATGDSLLIEGDITKSYKDAAKYLRQLTSCYDQINKPNAALQSTTVSKLTSMMANVKESGYSKAVMTNVIADSTKLLVSYIVLQGEKTEILKLLVEQMERAGDGVLLRHGVVRKSYNDGADRLRGKNTDQLSVSSADPVVARKIQIKLNNLMSGNTPDKYTSLIDDVIEDATMYLAVHILKPLTIKVCKCMKNVFVQCELWCDEILRRVGRPCCTCSRHVSAQALADLAPAQRLLVSPGASRVFAPGLEISLTQCPSKQRTSKRGQKTPICPAPRPTSGCEKVSASYLMYSPTFIQSQLYSGSSSYLRPGLISDSLESDESSPTTPLSISPVISPILLRSHGIFTQGNEQLLHQTDAESNFEPDQERSDSSTPGSYHTPPTTAYGTIPDPKSPFWQSPTTMRAEAQLTQDIDMQAQTTLQRRDSPTVSRGKSTFNCRTPIITTDQMADWHAMMVSLMWNVQAWRDWIQENIDRALVYKSLPETITDSEDNWASFQRNISKEALQWRQYNIFSRQLTLRLSLRYRDKQIVSPTRATLKTEAYTKCQNEMLEVIDMLNRWTQWLIVVIKETESLQQTSTDIPLHEVRWRHFKKKVEEYADDWSKYNTHLKHCWENKYRSTMSDWLPTWSQQGPVWVVSACGAVPSGAVAAGIFDGEVTWVARTTHKCNVLPAALHPSKHCCLVYADGGVYHYTKYQVMCNAEVKWVPWRAGEVGARAVRVAPGVHVGRVHYRGSHLLGAVSAPTYRCHVVIFGRPFAFNCYDLLVLSSNEE